MRQRALSITEFKPIKWGRSNSTKIMIDKRLGDVYYINVLDVGSKKSDTIVANFYPGAVRLHRNEVRALGMVREFEEQAARMERRSIFKEAAKCAEELGLKLDLEHAHVIKKEVRRCQIEKLEDEIRNQRWQGSLVTTRLKDESLSADGCFWWLTEWKNCPSHTIAGLVELYEQLLPTRVYASHKTHTSGEGEVRCRLCGKAPESVAHILSGCSVLAQSKYFSRHDAALKVLFYELLYDEGFIDEIPPWSSPDKLKPVYESENVKAYWDVPIYADQQEVRCNRVDARIVNHMCKRVVTLEMSCPWVNNRTRKDEEKTLKYGSLRWELRQQFPGYEVKQYNIIMDALGGWSRELDVMMASWWEAEGQTYCERCRGQCSRAR
ncbi:hypothetical protein AWC38_SpisGene24112 [Stylophora pistillata]|uniref:Reverse transcriptase zinc-binding domain-containing protein n=1 Tax=Stylophora pistillata TaxID=50429 RepID=A0A2B4R685_STYPI|nr:hypothetical protein AWC38_SpisGene24112 [Stylophora pistillata]